MFNSVTLGFELSSSHTYNYIPLNIRMKTNIFKKLGHHKNSYMTCTTKGKGT